MRMSKLFFQTLREAPADAEVISHQLMLRAGLVRQMAAGIFDFLPLGLRVKQKIEEHFPRRDERHRRAGGDSSRWFIQPNSGSTAGAGQIGDDMARFKDRKGATCVWP